MNKKMSAFILVALTYFSVPAHAEAEKVNPLILTQVELVFSLFDTNHDGQLDKFEAVHSYAIYQSIIVQLLEKTGVDGIIAQPTRRSGVYLFLLQNGRFPETTVEFKSMIKFINDSRDINTTNKWDISVDRLALTRVFKYFEVKLAPEIN